MAKASKIPVAVMNNLPAAVSIQRPCYAMATTDGQSADITMYGEIVEEQPVDWGTGEPIPGQYIIESEFLDDLNRISGCDNITIHMDSLGGNAGVSILVHNKLRDLAAKGAKLTCIVDGVAMSGGSLIMCACDTVKVNPSSLVMIHKCWSFIWGAYNAEDLRKAADVNDAWDKSQVSIYRRKTGISETVLLHMMADTSSWMQSSAAAIHPHFPKQRAAPANCKRKSAVCRVCRLTYRPTPNSRPPLKRHKPSWTI